MLTEFALTPAVFDESAHDEVDVWLEQLRELGAGMFPRSPICSSIVASLYGGGWRTEVQHIVEHVSEPRAKTLCMSLLKQLDGVIVKRNLRGDWPEDDLAWAREANASHTLEPIDRIVTTPRTFALVHDEFPHIRSLEEATHGGFWNDIGTTLSPIMVASEQVRLLRKICIHSDWIALINPYGCTSEQRFCIELILANLRAPSAIGPRHFELHAQAKDGIDEVQRQENVVASIRHAIQAHLNHGQTVDVFHWPQLRERIFMGGTFALDSSNSSLKSPKWAVSLSHVAHETDQPHERTHWTLLSRRDLRYWFDLHISEAAHGKPPASRIN